MVGGTGGDRGASLEGLRDIYYDPDGFDVLPFYHNYTDTGDWVFTGYFIPSYIGAVTKYGTDINGNKRQLLDDRGYCFWLNYKELLDLDRSKLLNNPKALIDHSAEYCYTAEEAFALEGENKFNKVNIAEQLTKIRALKKCPPILKGFVKYRYKENKHNPENIIGWYWQEHGGSNFRILEHPLWEQESKKDENGEIIWNPPSEPIDNLYVIGIDGIDIGKLQTSENTKDPSDFCLVVYKRAYGLEEPKIVAIYKDRPNDIREAYKIAFSIILYYNAKVNIEATRQGIIPHAKEFTIKGLKIIKSFMKRPRATLSDSAKNTNTLFGTPATVAIIDHQTDLIADYVNDYCHLIWFEDLLDELNRYTDENKRKFDIVAAFAMALLADEELSGKVPKQVEKEDNSWQDIGYYTDENGIKRYGIIPKKIVSILANIWTTYENLGIRTSNPRNYEGYI